MTMISDHAEFMEACGQTVGEVNPKQVLLYIRLIEEELDELKAALGDGDTVGVLDGVLDVLVTTIGAGLSQFRVDQLEAGWDEVFVSNMSKLDPETGRAIKRDDGKVLKGANYFKPNLGQFL